MKQFCVLFALSFALLGAVFKAQASEEIYAAGREAKAAGRLEEAYGLFKKACMADPGIAASCLAWGELARLEENGRDEKRALGSAVMLEPANVMGRYRLAMMLLKKQDFTWAAEHLEAAVANAKRQSNRSLLHYYLGYALYKNTRYDEAKTQFELAEPGLPAKLKQRATYYLGLIAEREPAKSKWASHMLEVSKGGDPAWSDAAASRLERSSAFPRRRGLSGQVIASIGINTHPSSAFLDDVDTKSPPVLQSVFRADGIYSAGGYTDGFRGSLTAYREQNWTELGETKVDAGATTEPSPFEPGDFNATLLIGQIAYIRRAWIGDLENEILFGIDQENQFLDNVPKKNSAGTYEETSFGMNGVAVSGKAWWSFAANSSTIYGARLKVELRRNNIDSDRSATRFRLRLLGTRHILNRAIRLRAMVGTRYDRTYANAQVFKYDRLVPHLDANLRIRTPLKRLTVALGGKLKYNWYLNSRGNAENSFRPPYQDVDNISDAVNDLYEEGYYAETRRDFEWELSGELKLGLWRKAILALVYRHHQRITNLDGAPTPLTETWPNSGIWERAEAPTFGYVQDVVMLEMRQGF